MVRTNYTQTAAEMQKIGRQQDILSAVSLLLTVGSAILFLFGGFNAGFEEGLSRYSAPEGVEIHVGNGDLTAE